MAETTVVAPAMASNDTGSDKGIPFQSPAPLVAKAIQADAGSASTSRPVFRVPDGDYVGIVSSGFETVNSAYRTQLTAPPTHAPPEHRRLRLVGDSILTGPLIRLDAWWNGHPLDRTRVSHLARLGLSLAA
ncbi:hypothetical protein [Streptomyces anulatus]|uniref:hypothetical protein n=1 Tax=Streptomyces anulatus TaxID=1892 RepID=UPI003675C4E9